MTRSSAARSVEAVDGLDEGEMISVIVVETVSEETVSVIVVETVSETVLVETVVETGVEIVSEAASATT